jgi:hypothetical protein
MTRVSPSRPQSLRFYAWRHETGAARSSPGRERRKGEIVAILTTGSLLMRIFGYEGTTLMRRVDLTNVKVQR